MLQKYSFFCVFALLLTGFHWWSTKVVSPGEFSDPTILPSARDESILTEKTDLRRELLETMDRLVYLENQYRSIHGHFTLLINQLGYPVPLRLSQHYEIRIARASKSGLQISAISEEEGKVVDRVWIDESYRMTANFTLPTPSVEYLKQHAARELRKLRESDIQLAQQDEIAHAEEGIFKGYFRYELRHDSDDRIIPVAVGIQSPVLGLQLESAAKISYLGEIKKGSRENLDSAARSNNPNLEVSEVSEYAKQWTDFTQLTEANRRVASLKSDPDASASRADADDSAQELGSSGSSHLVIEEISE